MDEPDVRSLLAKELRLYRTALDLSVAELARMTNISRSKLSKVEHGHAAPSATDLRALAGALRLSDTQVNVLTNYVQDIRGRLIPEVGPTIRPSVSDERTWGAVVMKARRSRVNVRESIPVMLQSYAYMAEMHRYFPESALERQRARIQMQAALFNQRCHFTFVFRERELRRMPVGHMEVIAQLSQLIEVSRLPNVEYRLVPAGTSEHPSTSFDFTIYDDREVFVDNSEETIIKRRPEEVSRHIKMFDDAIAASATHDESVDMIHKVVADIGLPIDGRDAPGF